MANSYSQTYDIDTGTTFSIVVPTYGTRSVIIENKSGSFVLVNIGNASPPSNDDTADITIEPYTRQTIPTTSKYFGIRVIANISGISVPSTVSAGKLNFYAYNQFAPSSIQQIVGAPTTISPVYAEETYPYGVVGEDRLATGSYSSINATGYNNLRFYINNDSEYVARIQIVIANNSLSSVPENYNYIIGAKRADFIAIPLRMALGSTTTITPELFIHSANTSFVTVVPVLSQHNEYVSTVPDYGAYNVYYEQANLAVGTPVSLVVGPIFLFGVLAKHTIKPGDLSISIGVYNTFSGIETKRLISGFITATANGVDIGFGPVEFPSALWIPLGDEIKVTSTVNLNNVDCWVYYSN